MYLVLQGNFFKVILKSKQFSTCNPKFSISGTTHVPSYYQCL